MSEPSGWSRGYPVSESYPASWHSFQSPAHLRAICAVAGVAWEVGPLTPLVIAEVGCGTGYTAQMLAAGNPHWQVVGMDYNPAHIAEARSAATAARLDNLQFLEVDLAELGDDEIDRLPEFDLVTVHGVWSWVADSVREGVLRILRRRLKAGGLVFMSYNAMPGAAGTQGLARLVRKPMIAAGNSEEGVAVAAKLVQRLVAAEPTHLPSSGWRRLLTGETKGARPGYLMHEFQTEHWRPTFHADVAAAMATARCDYVASATVDENFPQMSLTEAQRAVWEEAPDVATRELIFDLCVARAFRRDVYVRGMRRVPRDAAVDALWFASATRAQGEVALHAQAGEAKLPQPLIDAVRAALADGPCTIKTLRGLPGCGNVFPAELAALLMGSGCAVPLWRHPQADPDWGQAVAAARRLNAVSADRLAWFGVGAGGQLGLATPALGGGLAATPMELAIARLIAETPPEQLDSVNATTLLTRLLPGEMMPPPEVLAPLQRDVAAMLEDRWPVWRSLGIV